MKKFIIASVFILTLLIMCSCSKASDGDLQSSTETAPMPPDTESGIQDIGDKLEDTFSQGTEFPTSETVAEYTPETGVTVIALSDSNTEIVGSGASVFDNTVTISSSGTYVISGKLSDGQIIVDTEDEEKVKLILNGVNISSNSSAIFVVSAPKKVILNSLKGSVNLFSDGTDYIVPDAEQVEGEIYPNACIYSCEDLKFSGDGEIYITSNCGKGINSKDDIEITSGKIIINSADDGIRGNDSVTISGGTVTVISGADGIKSSNDENAEKGYINISGGEINVKSATDAVQSASTLTVSGGTFNLLCAGGVNTATVSTTATTASDNSRRPGGGGMIPGIPGGGTRPGGGMNEGNSNKPNYSCKSLKSSGDIIISGGNFTISTPDDGIHSDTQISISGGVFNIAAGDDGIHADEALTVDDGDITVVTSYEAIESVVITVNGGKFSLVSKGDGFNACGGTTSSGSLTPLLTFNGGDITVNASGDGIDSNGNIVMTGGKVIVYGPTDNGNGAIDFGDRNYNMTISGGTLLAVGSSGMAETATGIGQAVIGAKNVNISAGSTVSITSSDGSVIFEFTTPKSMSSIVFSSSSVYAGEKYTVKVDGKDMVTLSAS